MTINVACVLRTGARVVDRQPYRPEHVAKLARGVARWLAEPHRFVCLTDQVAAVEAEGIEAIPLETDWPGWWAKIELFRPRLLTGPTLYLDLDSLVVGPLAPLVREVAGITMVADFGRPEMMNSSAMAWCGDMSAIWRAFQRGPEATRAEYDARRGPGLGDQGFIHDTLRDMGEAIDTFDRRHVVSFKMAARTCAPPDARVLSFHGRPKPDDPTARWAYDAWRAL